MPCGDLVVAGLDRAVDAAQPRERDERPLVRRAPSPPRARARPTCRLAPGFTSNTNGDAGSGSGCASHHHANAATAPRDHEQRSPRSVQARNATGRDTRGDGRRRWDARRRRPRGPADYNRPMTPRSRSPRTIAHRLHADRDPGRHRDPRHPRRARRAARARATRRGARHRREERHRDDHAGAEALSPRQPALSDDRAGTCRAGRAADAAAGAARTGSRTVISSACRRIRGASRTST